MVCARLCFILSLLFTAIVLMHPEQDSGMVPTSSEPREHSDVPKFIGKHPDLARYIEHYPGLRETEHSWNVRFYRDEVPALPQSEKLADILRDWSGRYDVLEYRHDYVQWLFPIRGDSGVNMHAFPLTVSEAKVFREDATIRARIVRVTAIMLDFWGISLSLPSTSSSTPSAPPPCSSSPAVVEDGPGLAALAVPSGPRAVAELVRYDGGDGAELLVSRAPHAQRQYHNLIQHSHNWLRVTRVLKFLGEVGMEGLQSTLVWHFISEAFGSSRGGRDASAPLAPLADSAVTFFAGTVRDPAARASIERFVKARGYRPPSRSRGCFR
eukprot:TRINITY_DN55713_c0_g1_i1.p1 TRINITY_DN55713_c0_g1~~TRINITY_DN55713_c0_g1_i1.p1  ORF type:complete len:325 (-),score=21.62 TRINITY_DN55713_c0_g1_i1:93-1067(-)